MQQIEELERQAQAEIAKVQSSSDLRELELKYLGKSGLVTGLMRGIGQLPPEDKPRFGAAVNECRDRLQTLLDEKAAQLKSREQAEAFEAERIDPTMPGVPRRAGYEHVLQQATNRIQAVLGGLGFQYRESPELELFKYNFEALNYPPDHPALDEQDTFYVDDRYLLRTQCTALQGRVFENTKPPLRFFTVGRTYRNEAVDRTHSHTFHQVDAFMIDEGVSMAHLKGTLGQFARAMFGESVRVRFRPDFFPFVEPGVDYAISCPFCQGQGCAVCKGSGWIELGGAGLIHPNILESFEIDIERFSGFAFGLGVERIPMLAYGIDDLRHFLENDLRFLEQFR
ncbi:MAG TPA: phenylalanine--tRNA ligase subunit alpha [Fimbriimonadaceae bacterium]|nr:phenylalanine--tRNA ligase subunit alpha [Fimbriimonadaceae bacterium]